MAINVKVTHWYKWVYKLVNVEDVRSSVISCGKLEKIIPLSDNDVVMPKAYTRFVYFFSNEKDDPKFMDAADLKKSLEKTLQYYPIFGGNVIIHSDGKMEVQPSSASKVGVSFIESEANFTLKELMDLEYSKMPSGLEASSWAPIKWDDFTVLLIVKRTQLKCKSVVIGISVHHSICDGASTFELMTTWSKVHTNQNLVIPLMDRTSIIQHSHTTSTS